MRPDIDTEPESREIVRSESAAGRQQWVGAESRERAPEVDDEGADFRRLIVLRKRGLDNTDDENTSEEPTAEHFRVKPSTASRRLFFAETRIEFGKGLRIAVAELHAGAVVGRGLLRHLESGPGDAGIQADGSLLEREDHPDFLIGFQH